MAGVDEAWRVGVRIARVTVLAVAAVVLLHAAAWLIVADQVRELSARVQNEATSRMIDLRVGGVQRAGYPQAAGVLWRDVTLGPRGMPFGVTVATARIAFLLVPSLRHAPVYRTELPDPVRIVLASGVTIAFAAREARIDAAWGDPNTPTLTASGATVTTGATGTGSVGIVDIAELRATLRLAARTLTLQGDGIEWRDSTTPLSLAAVTAETAIDGPPLPWLSDGGPEVRDALARWRDGGGAMRIVRAACGFGSTDVEAQGRISLDAELQPAATGELRVAGGDAGLRSLAASGLLPPRTAQAMRALLALVPATVKLGAREAVRLPVTLTSGRLGVAGYPLLRLAPLSLP